MQTNLSRLLESAQESTGTDISLTISFNPDAGLWSAVVCSLNALGEEDDVIDDVDGHQMIGEGRTVLDAIDALIR